jgi:predicted GNAT superfamily acetyltransferase
MSTERWCNDTDKGKPKYLKKLLSQCHVHHKSHIYSRRLVWAMTVRRGSASITTLSNTAVIAILWCDALHRLLQLAADGSSNRRTNSAINREVFVTSTVSTPPPPEKNRRVLTLEHRWNVRAHVRNFLADSFYNASRSGHAYFFCRSRLLHLSVFPAHFLSVSFTFGNKYYNQSLSAFQAA